MISGPQLKQKEHPLVAVVIPNRNGAEFLRRNLPSVGCTEYPNWISVLADNASNDESVELTEKEFDFCEVIAGKSDRGFAGNVNRGLRWGLARRSKYIAVISNDVRLPSGWLDCAVVSLEDNPKIGVLGFRETIRESELNIPREVLVEDTVYPSGCAFVLRSEAVRRVGLYDEVLYMYGEEQDYYPRMVKAGYDLAKINVPVLHERHGLREISPAGVYLRYRNAIYCATKNFGVVSGAIVGAKMFCYAVLPEGVLRWVRSSRLSKLASEATLSEGPKAAVDTSVSLRSGGWMQRMGLFISAVGWNMLRLPATLMRRRSGQRAAITGTLFGGTKKMTWGQLNGTVENSAALANAEIYESETPRVYIDGAPHLKPPQLRMLFDRLAGEVYDRAAQRSERPRMLDLGAGEGSLARWFLEHGAVVTAIDIAENRLLDLKEHCAGFGDRLEVCCQDINQTLAEVKQPYDIIAINSVLHHVPDYLTLLDKAIAALGPSGQIFSFQEPLRYDSLRGFSRGFSGLAYYSWRITRGDVWGGLARYLRRDRGVYLENCSQDNAGYHATRNGVDHEAIAKLVIKRNLDCRIVKYFSTQSRVFQPIGTMLKLENTFAVVGRKRSDPR